MKVISGSLLILPILIQTAFNIVSAIANALAEKLPTLIPTIVQGIMNIVQTIDGFFFFHFPSFLSDSRSVRHQLDLLYPQPEAPVLQARIS